MFALVYGHVLRVVVMSGVVTLCICVCVCVIVPCVRGTRFFHEEALGRNAVSETLPFTRLGLI